MDTTSAPPVSPAEGSPTTPSPEVMDEYLKQLEAQYEYEKWSWMARYVPPVMQKHFLEKYPPPPAFSTTAVDEEDVRQAESKRGEAAPNEPKQYIDAQGNTIDPKQVPAA